MANWRQLSPSSSMWPGGKTLPSSVPLAACDSVNTEVMLTCACVCACTFEHSHAKTQSTASETDHLFAKHMVERES